MDVGKFSSCQIKILRLGHSPVCASPPNTINKWKIYCGEIVVDSQTNLTWQRNAPDECESNSCDWSDAKSYCDNLELAGKKDWCLPKIIELRSLIEGCPATEIEGSCNISELDCLEETAWNDYCNDASCKGCGDLGDCYWNSDVWKGTCGMYWSSAANSLIPEYPWVVDFWNGAVTTGGSCLSGCEVRCVYP